jgi:hypothetical protein
MRNCGRVTSPLLVAATQTGLRCPPVALPSVVGELLPVALSLEPPLPPLQLMRVTQTARRMNMREIIGVLSMVPWLPLEGGSMTSLRHKACSNGCLGALTDLE